MAMVIVVLGIVHSGNAFVVFPVVHSVRAIVLAFP